MEANFERVPQGFAAVCKECGNGTLNNSTNDRFVEIVGYDEFEGMNYVVCRVCHSTHVDVVGHHSQHPEADREDS